MMNRLIAGAVMAVCCLLHLSCSDGGDSDVVVGYDSGDIVLLQGCKPVVVQLEGLCNMADLGGLEMSDGRRVKAGLLYRAGKPDALTDGDVEVITSRLGVRRVIDLRNRHEQSSAAASPLGTADGVELTWLPLLSVQNMAWLKVEYPDMSEETLLSAATDEHAADMAAALYDVILNDSYSRKQLAAFIRMLAEADGAPVLWHCSIGRDRTGLAAAVLLMALGADMVTVVTHFEWGARLAAGGIEETGRQDTIAPSLCTVRLLLLLFDLERRCGSLEAYVTSELGITANELQALRRRYLE